MSKFITIVYTGETTKAALVEASAYRVAVERVCEMLCLRGVDVKYIFENATSIDDRADPPKMQHGDIIALTEDTESGWMHPEPQYKGDKAFLVTCFTRKERSYVEFFLVSAPNGYAALLDPYIWPIGMGVRAHQKRIDRAIVEDQLTEYDLAYQVFHLDGTEVSLKDAQEVYSKHPEWWVHGNLKGE